jgi:predicted ATPase
MRVKQAKVENYRSIRDTDWFDLEEKKTILVGANEAGKTAILRALQQINPPKDVEPLDALRDYPRALYNDISTGKVDPARVKVATVKFALEQGDKASIPDEFHNAKYVVGRYLNNSAWHDLEGCASPPTVSEIKKEFSRLVAHIEPRYVAPEGAAAESPSKLLDDCFAGVPEQSAIQGELTTKLTAWLDKHYALIQEGNQAEDIRFDKLKALTTYAERKKTAMDTLFKQVPVFVLFSNYFRVHPVIHLAHLAARQANSTLDEKLYDYGNTCLLKLLGFTAKELSDLGKAPEPNAGDAVALKRYRDQLDERQYKLDAASVRLTREIRTIWKPQEGKAEADELHIQADQQYLKVVVADDLGVKVELNQRSEGFQWLVSFFVVFFAEAVDKYRDAILLLDEPGLSLHGLKQREFRDTLTRLSETNQTLYTTHSPFLVGPDELDLVRVVEMKDRSSGTKVHTTVTADDPASLLPLQEALGYDLAQSLFAQQRNLILEGLTDFWYVEAIADLLRDAKVANLNEKIALISANAASKVVYFATILHAHHLKVAALLDSDTEGDRAAQQDTLVHTLGNKRILRERCVHWLSEETRS